MARYWGLGLSRIFVLKSHLDWRPPYKTQFLLKSCDLIFVLNDELYIIIAVLPERQLAFSMVSIVDLFRRAAAATAGSDRRCCWTLRQKCIMTARVCFVDFCSRFWRRRYILTARPQCFFDFSYFLRSAGFIGCSESFQNMLVMWLQRRDVPNYSVFHSACRTRCAFGGVMWVKSTPE